VEAPSGINDVETLRFYC